MWETGSGRSSDTVQTRCGRESGRAGADTRRPAAHADGTHFLPWPIGKITAEKCHGFRGFHRFKFRQIRGIRGVFAFPLLAIHAQLLMTLWIAASDVSFTARVARWRGGVRQSFRIDTEPSRIRRRGEKTDPHRVNLCYSATSNFVTIFPTLNCFSLHLLLTSRRRSQDRQDARALPNSQETWCCTYESD